MDSSLASMPQRMHLSSDENLNQTHNQQEPIMKAVRVSKDASTASLAIAEIPKPTPASGELLVKIKASFIQPADILNSKGSFPITTFPRTIGKDFSGTVISGSPDWINTDVYGTSGSTFSFTEDGAQAEFAVLREDCVAVKPGNLSFAQAAAVGTPFTTAFTALKRARVVEREVVMVLGATGAVGSAVVQIAKSMGCRTITVGRHGTDVDSTKDPELQSAKDLSDGKGPDVVVDTVGDFALTKAAFNVLAPKGRLSTITAPRQGSTELAVDILSLYRRQIELIGCNTASMPQADFARMMEGMTQQFESGALTAPEESTMTKISIDDAPDAYSGKIKRAVIVFE
ncbi:uncharacterized protein LTR77_007140 [Saxophila tyrrhenica]|uniref:Enoyl reductase (ER) domain-containing protein n=1 Tax=Saxophila tyrrhenica TaxID=1690608 RepID=A0AAV9P3W1_9PEZI|nr:hypothetical protein LTR77_007140 [Saxophila tyrrhenica]